MEKFAEIESIRKHIEETIKYMVDNPSKSNVVAKRGEQTVNYEVSVSKEDLGKVIGQKGRNAQALRTLLNAYSAKAKIRAVLNINE